MLVPNIYYWEEKVSDKPVKMTAAFEIKGQHYGLSYPMEDNEVKNRMNKKKLIEKVRDSLDVILHHGKKVLDLGGNINPKLVNDAEAERFWLDKLWDKRIKAFLKIVRIKEITQEQARKIGLL